MSATISRTNRFVDLSARTITADGKEQTIIKTNIVGLISGYVDLENMKSEDEIVIRMYIRVTENGEYAFYHSDTYSGVQEESVLRIEPKESDNGLKVTLQQTKGTFKSFDYDFLVEV